MICASDRGKRSPTQEQNIMATTLPAKPKAGDRIAFTTPLGSRIVATFVAMWQGATDPDHVVLTVTDPSAPILNQYDAGPVGAASYQLPRINRSSISVIGTEDRVDTLVNAVHVLREIAESASSVPAETLRAKAQAAIDAIRNVNA
jgi:hypothetical protein